MHPFLVLFEVIWLLYYISINIATYAIANNGTLIIERAVRQDVFNLGTHISVFLVTIHGKCAPWMMVLIGFELFRDVINAVNLQIFSPLQSFNNDLWVGVLVLAWYQVALSLAGIVACLLQQQQKVTVYIRK